MDTSRIKEFISKSLLEVYITEDKIISIGLAWGYSKYMGYLGFKRTEQISILNHLETLNQTELKGLGVLI